MNKRKQQIAIAKACKWYSEGELELIQTGFASASRYINKDGNIVFPVDYLNDLNAMHEAEKVFWQEPYSEDGTLHTWATTLSNVVSGRNDFVPSWSYIIYAEPHHRAEAFLRTLNLWEDEE